jgi:hypothetical protein
VLFDGGMKKAEGSLFFQQAWRGFFNPAGFTLALPGVAHIAKIFTGGLGVGEELLEPLWVGGGNVVVLVNVFGQIE